nr:MAG TPA: hypothetical protein [Caudoviricetes sp.]
MSSAPYRRQSRAITLSAIQYIHYWYVISTTKDTYTI